MTDFADLIEPVARQLLGEPNKHLSKGDELRFGTNGSMKVVIGGPNKGTWYSHEEGKGGGVVDLVAREKGLSESAAKDWLRSTFSREPAPAARKGEIAARYEYCAADGTLLYEVVRMVPKDFRQRRPAGKGKWIWNLQGIEPVPYRLPEIEEALAHGRPVFIVEGEKDADNLAELGVPATTNSGGSKKWSAGLSKYFQGADVVIVPDNDGPGADHAELVANSLSTYASKIRILELPDLPRKGDVSDWLRAGGTAESLNALASVAPVWRPETKTLLPTVWYGEEDAQPSLEWLVRGLLVSKGLSAVFGPPKSSKTFFTLDLALHIATGRDWFGRSVKQGGVVYVNGEGQAGLLQRMKAWGQENDAPASAPFMVISQAINLFDDHHDADLLVAAINAQRDRLAAPLRLLVLDTLSRMIGSGDEDKARDINVFVQNVDRLQRELGCHVMVVHHTGKDQGRGMRGSNALQGAVDAGIKVERATGGLCTAQLDLIKDGEAGQVFRYDLAKSVLGTDEEGEEIASCVVKPTDANASEPGTSTPKTGAAGIAFDALRRAINEEGLSSPGGQVPTSVRVVSSDTWRRYAFSMGVSPKGTDESKKRVFNRAREKLLNTHAIAEWDGQVWIARDSGT
ncbi:MAG: AAA family ATPase [Pseudomonadota bacterium]